MEFAENLALDHKFDKDLGHALKESPNNGGFHYFNTKKINVIDDDDDEEISGEILHSENTWFILHLVTMVYVMSWFMIADSKTEICCCSYDYLDIVVLLWTI